jgi:hypothetical protein
MRRWMCVSWVAVSFEVDATHSVCPGWYDELVRHRALGRPQNRLRWTCRCVVTLGNACLSCGFAR